MILAARSSIDIVLSWDAEEWLFSLLTLSDGVEEECDGLTLFAIFGLGLGSRGVSCALTTFLLRSMAEAGGWKLPGMSSSDDMGENWSRNASFDKDFTLLLVSTFLDLLLNILLCWETSPPTDLPCLPWSSSSDPNKFLNFLQLCCWLGGDTSSLFLLDDVFKPSDEHSILLKLSCGLLLASSSDDSKVMRSITSDELEDCVAGGDLLEVDGSETRD